MRNIVELKTNKTLLDSNFSGYKLSLDPVPSYNYCLKTDIDKVSPSDDQYSFLHVKLFSLHNCLIGDAWSEDSVYFINRLWNIQKLTFEECRNKLNGEETVWEIPSNHIRKPGHYNCSMSFCSINLAFVSDGAGTLHLVDTGNRTNNSSWKEVFSNEVCGEEQPFHIVDSRETEDDNGKRVDCLLMYIEQKQETESSTSKNLGSQAVTVIVWITLSKDEKGIWSIQRSRKLTGSGEINFIALEEGCQNIYIASNKEMKFIHDSEIPIETPEDCDTAKGEVDADPKEIFYQWTQSAEEIVIFVNIPEDLPKTDIHITCKDTQLQIMIKSDVILDGNLHHQVDSDSTTWNINKDRLEISVSKSENGLVWPEIIPGNKNGEYIPNAGFEESMKSCLHHLTSDKEVTEVSGDYPSLFNSEQLEECDAFSSESSFLYRINGNTHDTTHMISLSGNQWLFSKSLVSSLTPAICLRQDVDACIWQLSIENEPTDKWNCDHVGTFFAFGYVQASKCQRKFTTCAADMSFAVISETCRHVYIYRQPSNISGELRNRKTGKGFSKIAKQQLITLENNSEVLGIHASCNNLYVATKESVNMYTINP